MQKSKGPVWTLPSRSYFSGSGVRVGVAILRRRNEEGLDFEINSRWPDREVHG